MTVNDHLMDVGDGIPAIHRLDAGVVNRIAAGEVILRPANALKEMLENSLDAGAQSIIVTVKDGGLKVLQIQDDGHGVKDADFPLLCERHATSKLHAYEDLQDIQTLGFRGEALASISYVAHVTITSQTRDAPCGLRAVYHDGRMDAPGPKPCAAMPGTTVLVEDLFYNSPLRRKAMRSAGEEYSAILDVVGRYAVYAAHASLTCKRQGEARSELHTTGTGARQDAIRAVYGVACARHLLPIQFVCGGGPGADTGTDTELCCAVNGFVTSADYSGKRTVFVLFINGRAVECGALKRAVEGCYATLLPRTVKPFVMLDIRMPGRHVDVNVHPTKREVGFLHAAELIQQLRQALEQRLLDCNETRSFRQTLLSGAPCIEAVPSSQAPSQYYRPDRLVRTDARTQTLHAFMSQPMTQASQGVDPEWEASQTCDVGGGRDEDRDGTGTGGDAEMADGGDGLARDDSMHGSPLQMTTPPPGGADAGAAQTVPVRRRRARWNDDDAEGSFAFMPTALEIGGGARAAIDAAAALGDEGACQAPARDASAASSQCAAGGGQGPGRQVGVLGRRVARGNGARPLAASALSSVAALLEEVARQTHRGLRDILGTNTFVGLADPCRALVQHGTRLFLLDLSALSHDLFYQQVLRCFGQFERIQLRPALRIADLVTLALEVEEMVGVWKESAEEGTKEEIAALMTMLLQQKAALLSDHFSFEVDADGMLHAVPQLLPDYLPDLNRLPACILDMGRHVVWDNERDCFHSTALVLASLYEWRPGAESGFASSTGGEGRAARQSGDGAGVSASQPATQPALAPAWTVEHVLLPCVRSGLSPPRCRASDGSVVELTRLERLYRVFERC